MTYDEWRETLLSTMRMGGYVMTNKKVIEAVGLPAASFLAVLMDKDFYFADINGRTEDGYFYETIEHMEKITKVNRYDQDLLIQILKKNNYIQTTLRGLPARRHFRILYDTIGSSVKQVCKDSANCEIPTTYEESTNGSVCGSSANLSADILQQRNNKDIKNKSILIPKGNRGENPPLVKTIKLREARKPLNLVDTSVPPLARPEGAKPKFSKLHKIKPAPITFDIQQIIDYWDKKGLPGHNENSKSFDQAVIYITKAFNATLLEDFIDPKFRNYRFSVDSIKRSIDNFHLAAYDNKYEPLSLNTKQRLQSIRLKDFLYNRHSPDDQYKSHLFLYLSKRTLASESKHLVMKDTHEYCTKLVKDWYHQEFGGIVTEVSRSQQNSMILVGRKLEEFLVTHKDKLQMEDGMRMHGNYNPLNFLAGQLLRCASKMLRENDGLRAIFKPSWLISENMLGDRFIFFLKSERMLK